MFRQDYEACLEDFYFKDNYKNSEHSKSVSTIPISFTVNK